MEKALELYKFQTGNHPHLTSETFSPEQASAGRAAVKPFLQQPLPSPTSGYNVPPAFHAPAYQESL